MNNDFHAGYVAGLRTAAKEVRSHWNDGNTMTNQRDQAQRSANVLEGIANDYARTNHPAPVRQS